MLHLLSGGSQHHPDEYIGNEITAASIDEERLRLSFANGKIIEIWDNGQSCCEWRHMTTDDDIQTLVGHKLTRIDAKDGPDISDEDSDCHEQVFVEIGTDAGFVTIVNHNEHNGYYGGFELTITEVNN